MSTPVPESALAALLLAFYGAGVNLLAYLAFGLDKHLARAGARRIPEGVLLGLALFGGWPGAKLAQRRFRHKTRKQPFGAMLNLVVAFQIGVLVLFVSPFGATAVAGLKDALAGITRPSPQPSPRVMPRRFGPGS